MEEREEYIMNQKWYQKDWFLWACLILFAPVGIFLLWKNKRYSKNTTIALTVIFSILFIIALTHGKTNKPTEQIAATSQQQEVKQEEPKKEETPKQEAKVDYKLISTLDGQGYKSFYVVIPSIDKDSMISIIKEFKEKYPQKTLKDGFQIGFFLKDNEADAKNQDFSTAKAMYHENYNNGLSELHINATDETIEVK
jgi:hypothetical protein